MSGGQASTRYVRSSCRCHGLSGSCAMRTCFKRAPALSEVAGRLMTRFHAAVRVTVSNDDGRRLHPASRQHIDEDLVFSDESLDHCLRDRRAGSLGTGGRACKPRSTRFGGCSILCCGRGYRTRKVGVVQNCRCRFYWCCEVVCQTCVATRTVHECR